MAALTGQKVAGKVASGREMVAVGDAHRQAVTSRRRLVASRAAGAAQRLRVRRRGHGVLFRA